MNSPISAAHVARQFLDAVLWGEHLNVWQLMSGVARSAALAVAERNGLDAIVATRARAGTWTDGEADELLTDLVKGLRADLGGVDLSNITTADVEISMHPAGARATVALSVPSLLPTELTGGEGWAAGTIELVETATGWLVDRLNTRRVQRP